MYQHLHAPLPIESLGQIPQPISILLAVLLEKDPALRFQSPTQFLNALPMVMEAIESGNPLTRMRLESPADLAISRPP